MAVDTSTPAAVPAGTDAPPARMSGYRYLVVAVLALAYTFNFMDRQILALLAEPVKQELHLSDTQLGLLTGTAFALFYTVFGIPIASLADRSNRTRIVAAACAVWSLFSAGAGLATSFVQLAIMRVGVGVGEAGGATPSYSIISDYFPPARRGRALALFSLGVPFGSALGAALGGGVAARYGWRAGFYAVGLPGLLVALLILLVVREPRRGAQDPASAAPGTAEPPASMGEVIRMFFSTPVLRWTALGTGLASFAGYGVGAFNPRFLIAHQHMTLGQLAGPYALAVAAAVGAGTFLSGVLADRFSSRSPRAYALIPLGGSLVALPCFVAAYLTTSWLVSVVFLTIAGAAGILYLAPALTTVANNVPARARTTASALLLLVLNLVGLGGGPLFVGVVSDALKPRFGAEALKYALLSVSPVVVLAMGAYVLAAQALGRAHAARTAA